MNDSEGRFTETHNADGTTDTTGFARYGDVGVAVTTKKDAGGHVIGTPTRSLLLEGVDDSLVDGLYQVTGKTPPADPGGNVRLDFTEGQLEQLRQAALSRLADKIEMNRDGRPTNEEIARVAAGEPRRRRVQGRQLRLHRHRRLPRHGRDPRGRADRALPRRHELGRGRREPR